MDYVVSNMTLLFYRDEDDNMFKLCYTFTADINCRQQMQLFNCFRSFFFGISKFLNFMTIWHRHGKCITMSTNKPMVGPVALEIACGIFIDNVKPVVSMNYLLEA